MTNLVQFPGLGLEFNINRVAFTIGGLDVYWYGVLIATGFLLALVFAFRYAVDFGIDADRLVDVVLVGSVCAVICARTYYVIFSPVPYESFADMIDIRQGGLAIYGGVIGAAVFGGLACKWRKLPILPTFDLVAMGFLIGQSIGRWGNFVNQEAFGSNTTLPWGMYSQATANYLSSWQTVLAQDGVIVDPSMPVHPTFLYESIWCAVGFFALRAYMKKRRFNGEIALMYAAWYGAGRFWIEGLRTDSLMLPGMTLRVSQLIALISVLAAVIAIVLIRRKIGKKELLVDIPVSTASEKKFQKAKSAWADKLEALGQNVSLEELRQQLPASASHKEFVAAQKQQQEFDWEALIRQKLEQAEMDAGMQESVRQENVRFAQLPVDPEERAATNSSLTQGLDEK